MRFVYLGPPDEPSVAGTFHARTGEWVRGVPREISDDAAIARLLRHPHWAAVEEEAPDAPGLETAPELPDAPKKRGRPPKVR